MVRFVSVCGICQSQQKDGVSGLKRNAAQAAGFKAVIPCRTMLRTGPEKLRSLYSLQYVNVLFFAAGLDLLSLTYTTIVQTGTPDAVG